MRDPAYAAYLFCVLIAFVAAFQLALALGAPWGEMAMGGKYPGRLPLRMRVAALVQVVVLVFIALIVLTRAGVILDEFSSLSKSVIWVVVVFSLLGVILNAISPSKKERMLWVPVSIALLICAAYVAVSQEALNKSAVRLEPVQSAVEGGERRATEASWLHFVRGSTGSPRTGLLRLSLA